MKKLRIGVLGCSEFAGRAMLPAMKEVPEMELAAVASRAAAKARSYARRFGCEAVTGYAQLLRRGDIDAVYVPLPSGLHAEWIERSLEAGKHVLVEKPLAPDAKTAARVLGRARRRRLLVLENFLFPHHSQYAWVRRLLDRGELGDVRLFRSTFMIPALKAGNFRYRAALGGGALLDLGPYMARFAAEFLGEALTLVGSTLRFDAKRRVDVSGAAQYVNGQGQVAQVAYGFDAHYQCLWEFFGTRGKLVVERGYTPPPGFRPVAHIERPDGREKFVLPADNHYKNMCRFFARAVLGGGPFDAHWEAALSQAKRLELLRSRAVVS